MFDSLEDIYDNVKELEGTDKLSDLTHSQISYLRELDIPSEQWESMDEDSKRESLFSIASRFDELGIKEPCVIKTVLHDHFSHNIAEEFPLSYNDTGVEGRTDYKKEKYSITDATELSATDRTLLLEETGWSDVIINAIKTSEEADVYKEAGLKEANGNLERTDIDWNAKIPQNRIDRMRSLYGDEVADKWSDKTNMDLIKEGKAPYGTDGERINLHHIGQKPDNPLAELTNTEHKTKDAILHDKTKPSEIERPVFRRERETYWINRYYELTNN